MFEEEETGAAGKRGESVQGTRQARHTKVVLQVRQVRQTGGTGETGDEGCLQVRQLKLLEEPTKSCVASLFHFQVSTWRAILGLVVLFPIILAAFENTSLGSSRSGQKYGALSPGAAAAGADVKCSEKPGWIVCSETTLFAVAALLSRGQSKQRVKWRSGRGQGRVRVGSGQGMVRVGSGWGEGGVRAGSGEGQSRVRVGSGQGEWCSQAG